MSQIFAIVLAAGKGKRMNSNIPKVAHMLHKKSLLQWSIDSVLEADIKNIIVVISHHPVLEDILKQNYADENIRFCYQDIPLGTASAVQCGLTGLLGKTASTSQNTDVKNEKPWDEQDVILVTYGDTPKVKSKTYKQLYQFHTQEQNAITIIGFYAKNPSGYGRVILDEHNQFVAIREEKDCTAQEKQINLCHSGVLCANFDILNTLLPKINNKNKASEFYLTDIIGMAKNLGHKVGFIASDHEFEFSGVNTPEQLSMLETSSLCAV